MLLAALVGLVGVTMHTRHMHSDGVMTVDVTAVVDRDGAGATNRVSGA